MKTERSIYLIFITILVALNIYILYKYKHHKIEPEVKSISENPDIQVDTALYYNIFDIANASDNTKIDSNVILTTYTGNTLELFEVINNFPSLIFDFKHINCKTCFEDEMTRIINFSREIGTDNVIFISAFKNKREQYVLENKYGINVYDIGDKGLGLPIENEYCPFIFLLDSNYIADSFYVPTKEFYHMGNIYYNILYNKYFINRD
jgi:hypothetical protein